MVLSSYDQVTLNSLRSRQHQPRLRPQVPAKSTWNFHLCTTACWQDGSLPDRKQGLRLVVPAPLGHALVDSSVLEVAYSRRSRLHDRGKTGLVWVVDILPPAALSDVCA